MSAEPILMQESDARLPVTVLSGFLGAGKTTLLNHCGLRLTGDYIQRRISILTDPRQEETQRFSRS